MGSRLREIRVKQTLVVIENVSRIEIQGHTLSSDILIDLELT